MGAEFLDACVEGPAIAREGIWSVAGVAADALEGSGQVDAEALGPQTGVGDETFVLVDAAGLAVGTGLVALRAVARVGPEKILAHLSGTRANGLPDGEGPAKDAGAEAPLDYARRALVDVGAAAAVLQSVARESEGTCANHGADDGGPGIDGTCGVHPRGLEARILPSAHAARGQERQGLQCAFPEIPETPLTTQ